MFKVTIAWSCRSELHVCSERLNNQDGSVSYFFLDLLEGVHYFSLDLLEGDAIEQLESVNSHGCDKNLTNEVYYTHYHFSFMTVQNG